MDQSITKDRITSLLPKYYDPEFSSSRILHTFRDAYLFEGMGTLKKIPKNEIFIESDDPPKYCYLLKKGCVVGFEYSDEGNERIYDIMLPVSLILETTVMVNLPSPVYFKTVKPSEIVYIERHALLGRMSEDFRLTMALMESVINKFHAAMEQVRETKVHDVSWRFCNLLLMFAECFGDEYHHKTIIKEQVSQQLFADLLGVNRITVNRIAKTMKDMGLIELINGYYCLPDIERLKKHMEYTG